MKKDQSSKPDLREFRIGPMTLLELMAVLAFLGIFLSWLLVRFFS